MTFSRIKVITLLVCSLFALSFPGFSVDCAKNGPKGGGGGSGAPIPEAVIEEVNAKQLEKILADKDYVAVFWCKQNSGTRIYRIINCLKNGPFFDDKKKTRNTHFEFKCSKNIQIFRKLSSVCVLCEVVGAGVRD